MSDIDKLRDFIITKVVFKRDPSILKDTDALIGTGIIDSLGLIKLTLFIEAEFDVKVNRDQMTPENFYSLETIVDLINRLRKS
jgi:acyl carrier protein